MSDTFDAVALKEDRDSWYQQASDRLDDAVRFAAERDAARAECAALRAALAEAADDIADWGAYAGSYFQEKHDLAGCVAKYRAIVGDAK